MKRGLFISIEGIDGSGKTLFAEQLSRALKDADYDIHVTREPGGSEIGDNIRDVLKTTPIKDPIIQSLLFTASRRALVEQIVKPNLGKGKIVLTDRYIDSMNVYQTQQGVSSKVLQQLTPLGTTGLLPDLTIWIKTDPLLAWQRVRTREHLDQFDQATVDDFMAFEKGFQSLYEKDQLHNKRWFMINGADPIASNVKLLLKKIAELSKQTPGIN